MPHPSSIIIDSNVSTPQLIHLMEHLPFSIAQIKTWINHDPILARVRQWVLEGWPEEGISGEEFLPYFRRLELGVERGV